MIPGARAGLPAGLRRRQDLHAHAAPGPEVLATARPVKASDFPYTIERAIKLNWGGKSFFTGYIKGAAGLRRRQGQDDLRHQGRRRDRQDHDHADQALRRVPERARVPVRRPRADRDEDGQPLQRPAARRRPVHDQGRRPEPLLRRRPQPGLDATTIVPGRPAGPRRHQRQDRLEHADRGRAGAQQPGRRLRLGRPAPAVARCRRSQRRPSDRYKQQNTISTFYFFLNTQTQAVQQPAGARGGQLRARPAGAHAAQRRQLHARRAGSCPRAWSATRRGRARTATRTARRTWPRPSSSCSSPGMAGQPVTVWSETRSPRKEFVAYYTDVLNQIGFKAKSEDHRRRAVLRRRSATGSPSRRRASRTGTRTSRTRATSTC